jgi:predicted phage terminase large subunit-like protein
MVLTERQIFKEVCENDFAFYVKHFLKVVEPETNFEWNWHIDVLCNHCEQVYYGHIQNLDINIPPRTMKSLIVTVLFPTWVWTKNPAKKFLCASRSYDLAISFNHKRRDIIESREYQSLWPNPLRDDNNKADEFHNYHRGFMKSVSALGTITGEGADFLLSDDLVDAVKVFSRAYRESVNTWYSKAFYNRAQSKKNVRRINVNQRTHMEDPSGNIEKNHNFLKLVIPMVMTEKQLSTCGFVDPRKPGEFLFPTRYGKEEMDDDYKAQGVYGWSSQYQQSPVPIGGGIIKKEWLRYYETLPSFEKKIITGDLSFTGNSDSDYVCFQAWGRNGSSKYLIDIIRGRWSYKETKEKFVAFCAKHEPDILKYIEHKANGPALISDLKDIIRGIRAWPEKNSKYYNLDKVGRLHLVSQDFELGDVYLPKNIELVELFEQELLSFTEKGSSTGNDDMVDTCTMGLLELNKPATFFG